MALSLSTLTSPTTSGDVLAEIANHPQADFLDSVPVLRNIARGPNKGGDAKQTTALNQPKALPLIDGEGYLYLSGVTGNYASVPDPLGALDDFTLQADGLSPETVRPAALTTLISQWDSASVGFILYITTSNTIGFTYYYPTYGSEESTAEVPADTVGIRVTRVGTLLTYWVDTGSGYVSHDTSTIVDTALTDSNAPLRVGQYGTNGGPLLGKISRAVIWDNGTQAGDPVLDIDFTATNIRHNDTKFKCATGQTVTINQSGNDPATIIKKSVLRFNGSTSGLSGLFANNIDGGYMFAAFSVLGDGGDSYGRVFTTNLVGSGTDYSGTGAGFLMRNGTSNSSATFLTGAIRTQSGMFDDLNGDILHEVKIQNSSLLIKINNAGQDSVTHDDLVDSDQFNIGKNAVLTENAAIDLEYLALFPATISDAEAARVVTYINTRNNVFDLKDGFGYYFFDPQVFPNASPAAFVSYWNGNIVGSDNTLNSAVTQTVAIDQPTRDGFKIGFTGNTDHLDIPSTAQAGWQIVGTSLGTFAYRVNANAVTELNLLGNRGHPSFRKTGSLYAIILLPETANGKEIEVARKLLIDRGAADGATATSLNTYWYNRADIVEFKSVDTSGVTNMSYAWYGCGSLTSFPFIDTSSGTNFQNSWFGNASLTSFPALDMSSGATFQNAWQGCTALTSFPAGAQLGTAAENVNFDSAWRSSGLTSFSTPLPTAGDLYQTWRDCTSLTSFSTELPTATSVVYSWYYCTALSDFKTTEIPNCTNFTSAWQNCTALTSFPAGAKLGTAAANVNFTNAWRSSGLTSFSTPLPTATNVSFGWFDCSSLSGFTTTDISKCVNFAYAWRSTSSLVSFPSDAKLGTEANNVNFDSTWSASGLTSFSTPLPTSKNVFRAWNNCSSLIEFSSDVFSNWSPSSIQSAIFNETWEGCTSLTAQSVGNILQSIDASNQHGTDDGTSTGNPLGDSGIDIDYNVATGALSAATNTAVTSLKSKGWVIVVNGTTL